MSKKMRVMAALVIVAGLLVFAVGCGDDTSTTETTAVATETTAAATETTAATETSQANTEPIKIGLTLGLTGPGATGGEQQQKALTLLCDQTNAAGGVNGRQIELIIMDNAGDNSKGISNLEKLIQQDGVTAVIGTMSNPMYDAVGAVAEEAGVPLISFSTPTLEKGIKQFDYGFTLGPGPEALSDAYFKIAQANGATNIFAVANRAPLFQDVIKLVVEKAEEAGLQGTVWPEAYDYSLTDFTPVFQKIYADIQTQQPDFIVHVGIQADTGPVVKGLRNMGVTVPIVISPVSSVPKALFAGGTEVMEGLLVCAPGQMNADDLPDDYPGKELLVTFNNDYTAEYGEPPTMNAGQAYDGWYILLEGLKAGGDDRTKVRDGIEAIKDLQVTQGSFTYSPTDHAGIHGGYIEWMVVDGEFKFVRPIN